MGLLVPEEEGTTIRRNVGDCLPQSVV